MYYDFIKSSIGHLYLEANDKGLSKIIVIEPEDMHEAHPNEHTDTAKKELEEYFSHNLTHFTVSLDFTSGTPFQQKVWKSLLDIPYGKTTNYITLARNLGDAKSVRAVGSANGKNPIPIIVPCHRVIGSNGSLIGYALGIDIKKRLLALENPASFGTQQSLFD